MCVSSEIANIVRLFDMDMTLFTLGFVIACLAAQVCTTFSVCQSFILNVEHTVCGDIFIFKMVCFVFPLVIQLVINNTWYFVYYHNDSI